MSPEILRRKLDHLRRYLADLRRHQDLSRDDFEREHYAVERLIELVVEASSSVAFHVLSIEEGTSPGSYKDAFKRLGAAGFIPTNLAGRLGKLAGMRNILVHGYQQVDLDLVHQGIRPCIQDMEAFIQAAEQIKL
jgi:uncharacterized protein YutE (UPF0331/DUF86 family)